MAPSAQPGLDFIDFVNESPSPYHAVRAVRERLDKAGFQQLLETEDWSDKCRPGGKYYLTRNASTIAAWTVGQKWKPGEAFAIIGAHTDSPCLRVKPVSLHSSEGFLHGGGLWHTWFDRDLSLAGRAMVKSENDEIVHRLVNLRKPILRIPTLAIHLDRQEKFEFSKEAHLLPIAGLAAAELERQLEGLSTQESTGEQPSEQTSTADNDFEPLKPLRERHHPRLLEMIANSIHTKPEQIQDFELVCYDTQQSCTGGINDELIYSARLDNLEMSFCSSIALIESARPASLKNDSSIRMISLFDHEEIGSMSTQGAQSNLLPSLIRRLSSLTGGAFGNKGDARTSAYEQSLAKSFVISADMAHSVNPNYAGKYESKHRPVMNQGTVIKINANQRYATNSPGVVLLQEIAHDAKVPLQLFVVSNISPCGSTIGPFLASALGIRTLDLGNPQLSMHSIRETGGLYDVDHAIKLFKGFFSSYATLEPRILVDGAPTS